MYHIWYHDGNDWHLLDIPAVPASAVPAFLLICEEPLLFLREGELPPEN
jgi:hypothetical protein